MQVLKEEVRNAIIENAIKEFLEHGFEKASIRKIVKKAGTTIGNFYNYFSSKEELFYTITTPVYENFIYFIRHHNDDNDEMMIDFKRINVETLRNELVRLYKANNMYFSNTFASSFLILVDGSKGTKYENVKTEIINFLAEHFEEHIKRIQLNERNKVHFLFPHVIATSFLEGILDILRKNLSEKEITELIMEYILFFYSGFLGSFVD